MDYIRSNFSTSLFIIVLIRMVKLTKKLTVSKQENEKMNMDYKKLESIHQSTCLLIMH